MPNKEKVVEKFLSMIFLECLGVDKNDPHMKDTPKRLAKYWVNDVFKNIGKEFTNYTTFPNDEEYDQIITLRCNFHSVCAHHLLPFYGKAWLFYIPDKLIIGGSKPLRSVKHYAAMPQTQERLCHQVINSFDKAVKPKGVMVVMKANHTCMSCRGVDDPDAFMGAQAVKGLFATDDSAKMEALMLLE